MWIFLLSDTFIFSVLPGFGYMTVRMSTTDPWPPNPSEVFAIDHLAAPTSRCC